MADTSSLIRKNFINRFVFDRFSFQKSTVRVLYTINSSPQYVLARSHVKVPVSIIDDLHASTPLKECLKTIRRSRFLFKKFSSTFAICLMYNDSPELLQDSTRDFSVYVLDPLESLASPSPLNDPECSASGKSMPRGVAVSLGLMSWALSADENENVAVTGTLTKSSAVQQLEVVFLLREVGIISSFEKKKKTSSLIIGLDNRNTKIIVLRVPPAPSFHHPRLCCCALPWDYSIF
jgi:hypothetical protein